MARSYDPAFLPAATVATLADIDKAKQWYQRAASLGNVEAATRLNALNQGR
jgi:TPR repeat protein